MRVFLLLAATSVLTATAAAQSVAEQLKTLYDSGECQKAYELADATNELDAASYQTLAYCALNSDDFKLAASYLSSAVELEPNNVDYLYLLGESLGFDEQYKESIASFQKAIALQPDNPLFHTSEGHIYVALEDYEKAKKSYATAIEMPGCPEEAFMYLAELYWEEDNTAACRTIYEKAANSMGQGSPAWNEALYNLGLIQYLDADFAEAKDSWSKLYLHNGDDYELIAKLIQVHYALAEYDNADSLKAKMYLGYARGDLPERIQKSFCFDQFDWKDKRIHAYERFAEPDSGLYYKHVFVVYDAKSGEAEFTIQTEHSFALEMANAMYVLGSDRDGTHRSYWNHVYQKDFEYADLKAGVIAVLDGSTTATASSSFGKPEKKRKRKKKKR